MFKRNLSVSTFALFVSLLASTSAYAVAPSISSVPDQRAAQGDAYSFAPAINNSGLANWSKTYGPDDVIVDPITGKVSWSIPADLPSESFHIGVQVTNADGIDEQTWVLTVGTGAVHYIGVDEEITHIVGALAVAQSGDTMIVRNGNYGWQDGEMTIPGPSNQGAIMPAGTSTQYTTLMAEDPGQVVIDGEGEVDTLFFIVSNFDHPDHSFNGFNSSSDYSAFKGFVLKNTRSAAFQLHYGHHVKLIDIGLADSGRSGDCENEVTADNCNITNIYILRSEYILVEGLYSWGHSRYKMQFQSSNKSIARRSMGRIDEYRGAQPIGGFQTYCSKDIEWQNNIVLDGDSSRFWNHFKNFAASFAISATGCSAYPENINYVRSISLNNHNAAMDTAAGDAATRSTWTDLIGWDHDLSRFMHGTESHVAFLHGAGPTLTDQSTFGHLTAQPGYEGAPDSPGGKGFFYSRSQLSEITNSIMYQIGYNGSETTNQGNLAWGQINLAYNNIFDFAGTINSDLVLGSIDDEDLIEDSIETDPTQNGLLYLPKLEDDSPLRTAGKDGVRIGAEVMTFVGKSGTFWGDDGYNEETNIPMWPFPNERLKRSQMRDYSYTGQTRNGGPEDTLQGARGFAADDETLSNYIWGYLGNTPPPLNIHAVAGDTEVIILWDPPADKIRSSISNYHIYQVIGENKTLIQTVNGTTFNARITALTNGESYTYIVTAEHTSTGESSYAYRNIVTPHSISRPNPPVLTFIN